MRQALPAARRMESLTETNAMIRASAVQPTVELAVPCQLSQGIEEGTVAPLNEILPRAACRSAAIPTTTASTSAKVATTMPGKARFHGNGMGGGAEASRCTASMTEEVKPDDGRTSSWAPRMRSISGSFIVPPSRVVTSEDRKSGGEGGHV